MVTYAVAAASRPKPLFPLFADLARRAVVVIGGDTVAWRKAEDLLEAGATVNVVARKLDASLASITDILARERARIRSRFPQSTRRRRFFEQLLDGDWPERVRSGDANAQLAFEQALRTGVPESRTGRVTLVGAGPGAPGLLTLNGLRALHRADVIVHDRLVGPDILDLARHDAECIDVDKRAGENHAATQARIHELLIRYAHAGRYVVRLQGGDPTVFGRCGEELEFLRANAIPFDVIPGITAALACAAVVGIALTDRRYAHGVALLTAPGRRHRCWAAAAATQQTLAIYVGVREIEPLTAELIGYGRQGLTPCVLVECASLPEQRKLAGTLADIAVKARAQEFCAPALLIVGEVAAQATPAVHVDRCTDALASVACAA